MKLSEILSKPFKVKGGGTVNLKGLSKHIVDKEIEGGGGDFPYEYQVLYNFSFEITDETPSGYNKYSKISTFSPNINHVYNIIYKNNDTQEYGSSIGSGPQSVISSFGFAFNGPSSATVYFIFDNATLGDSDFSAGDIVVKISDSKSYPIERKKYFFSDIVFINVLK